MPEHAKPFVYETLNTKALHFSFSEIQSRMQVQRPDALDLDYTRTMMGVPLFNSQPRRMAMLNGTGPGKVYMPLESQSTDLEDDASIRNCRHPW